MSHHTAVATTTPTADRIATTIADIRRRNAVVAQIKGAMWAKECSGETIRAVADYCRENQLDATRHVEILGGRIYLTANFYEERGAPLVQSGAVIIEEPMHINADDRLDKMATSDGPNAEWAKAESAKRARLRVECNVPEGAKGAVIQRLTVTATGRAVVGVNWCGGTSKRDPVGEAEPSKTAVTRAARRAWKQIAAVLPDYGAQVLPLEASARVAIREEVALQQPVPSSSGFAPRLAAGEYGDDDAGELPLITHNDEPLEGSAHA
jgi:hypothetical protein